MKICVLGDCHFGMRNDSLEFHKYIEKFYENSFFPYLKENGITTVVQLGDLFDRRKFINFN
ncbi:MAG: endonuclease, partial [Chitinophagaceae bacterium]